MTPQAPPSPRRARRHPTAGFTSRPTGASWAAVPLMIAGTLSGILSTERASAQAPPTDPPPPPPPPAEAPSVEPPAPVLPSDVAPDVAPEDTTPPPSASPSPPWSRPPAAPVAPGAGDATVGFPEDLPRWIFDDARMPFPPPRRGHVRIDVHGELQLRGERLTELPLTPPVGDPASTTLGQRTWGTSWLRLNARATVSDKVRAVVQLDVVPRWTFGDVANDVDAAGESARTEHVTSFARLRYAYVDVVSPLGLLRAGQMGSHWGLGVVANDGDHPRLFGDHRYGAIVERVAFASRPAGRNTPLVVAIAGDAVMRDDTATWADGDRTYQAVGSVYYEQGATFVGLYGARRWQKVRADGQDGDLSAWVVDASARAATPLAGTDTYLYGGTELAAISGKTDAIRTSPEFTERKIRSYGGVASLGVVKRAAWDDGTTYGAIAVQFDFGYASGDADPYSGTIRRFTFDPNHQVGLVLFPFVMHFETARAATNAVDPSLSARPLPGTRFLTSKGGVFGAQYLNPTIVVRPRPNLDLKAGVVVAVATSDFVDPYRTALDGSFRNYRGGDARARDLGVELDGGVEYRVPLPPAATLQLGAQGGVLFPGHAFDDGQGGAMPWQGVVQGRVGVQF